MRLYEQRGKEIADLLKACELENRIYLGHFKKFASDFVREDRSKKHDVESAGLTLLRGISIRQGSTQRARILGAQLARIESEINAPIPDDLDSLYLQLRKALEKNI
jgi:hypothetical protein